MTSKQTKWYWREWAAVRRADPSADRHELHVKALGFDRSSKELTNDELDRVIAEFWRVCRPEGIDAQLRQLRQVTIRLRWKISHQQSDRLRKYVASPELYIQEILSSRFHRKTVEELDQKQLRDMVITLENRLRSMAGRAEEQPANEPF